MLSLPRQHWEETLARWNGRMMCTFKTCFIPVWMKNYCFMQIVRHFFLFLLWLLWLFPLGGIQEIQLEHLEHPQLAPQALSSVSSSGCWCFPRDQSIFFLSSPGRGLSQCCWHLWLCPAVTHVLTEPIPTLLNPQQEWGQQLSVFSLISTGFQLFVIIGFLLMLGNEWLLPHGCLSALEIVLPASEIQVQQNCAGALQWQHFSFPLFISSLPPAPSQVLIGR